jgi:hypothetical protein
MLRIVESQITWRGSLTDLVTDVSYLLTPEEGRQFIQEMERYLRTPHLASKWQGKGRTETV